MAAMNFPSSPSDGATFISDGGVTYIYNSTEGKWKTLLITADDALPLTGGGITGNLTVSGTVAVGTTSPTRKIEVGGDADGRFNGSNSGIYFNGSTSGASFAWVEDANGFKIGTNNTERLRIDSSGRVGVGTSSPSSLLHIGGNNGIRFGAGGTPEAEINYTAAGSEFLDLKCRGTNSTVGNIRFFTGNTSSAAVEAMRIDNFGRVGVGTTSPTETLTLNAATGASLGFEYGGTEIATISNNNAALYVHAQSGKLLSLGADGSEKMRIDSSGRVGIGTSSPGSLLQVGTGALSSNNVAAFLGGSTTFENAKTGNAPTITFNNDLDTGFLNPSANTLGFNTGGSRSITIDSSQRVGIGTTSPSYNLHVQRGASTGVSAQFGRESGSSLFVYNATTVSYLGSDSSASNAIGFLDGADALTFHTDTGSEKARIDSSGRLLVGTSSSASGGLSHYARLQVQGHYQGSADEARISFQRGESSASMSSGDKLAVISFADKDGGDYARIEAYADSTPGSSDYPGRLVFSTTADGASSPTERMRIRSDGHIGINHAGHDDVTVRVDGISGVQTGMHVLGTGSGNSYGIYGQATAGNSTQYGVYGDVTTNSTYSSGGVLGYSINSNTYGICGYWSGSAYWSFLGNGACGATAFTNVSDSRLKDVDSNLTGCLDKLANIQPVKYSWKENSQQRRSLGDGLEIGLLAEEVQAQFPELVSEMEWGEITGANPETLNEQLGTTLGVDYGRMTAVLIQALNEAKTRIETLETKVSALEAS